MHLAVGRAFTEGDYHPGDAIFANVPAGTSWVNHAWLFDLLLHGLYQIGADVSVVVVKALGLAALAGFLIAIRRRGPGLLLPTVSATGAVLAVSPRFEVAPLSVSFVLLAVTLYLLLGPAPPAARRLWLLPPLFALWANLDAWFILGPFLVLLLLIGEAVQSRLAAEAKPRLRKLGLVLGIGLAACLVNPYLFGVFELPTELGYLLAPVLPGGLTADGQAVRTVLEQQRVVFSTFSTPFSETYAQGIGRNAAGVAFYVLFALSLGSFVLTGLYLKGQGAFGRGVSLPLLLLWLPFAVLAALQIRMIAFFAVVAAPVTVLNLQDVLAHRFGTTVRVVPPWPGRLLGLRALAMLGALLLLFAAWPGWLNAQPDGPASHRVAFHAVDDPLWPEAARRLEELRQSGQLRNGFNFNYNVANRWAWHCGPTAKSFIDQRFGLFAGHATDYAAVRRALLEEFEAYSARKPPPPERSYVRKVHEIFRKYDINFIILGNDLEANRALHLFLNDARGQWPLLYTDGHTTIFGWNDPAKRPAGDTFAGQHWDFNRLAFGPVPQEQQAPPEGLAEPPQRPDWWQHYLQGAPAPPTTLPAVPVYHLIFQVNLNRWGLAYPGSWGLAALTAAASTTSVTPAYLSGVPLWVLARSDRLYLLEMIGKDNFGGWQTRPFVQGQDFGPPALPLLAVRAARRAAVDAPTDAGAHVAVAESTALLWKQQEEYWVFRSWQIHGPRGDKTAKWLVPGRYPNVYPWPVQGPVGGRVFQRANLRFLQYVTALHNAVRLQPGNIDLRKRLSDVYLQVGYFDVALEQLEAAQKHLLAGTATAVPTRESPEKLRKELDAVHRNLSNLVKQLTDDYELKAQLKSPLEKFRLAFLDPVQDAARKQPPRPRGLAVLGLKQLRAINRPGELNRDNAQQYVYWLLWLLLATGQTQEAQESLALDGVKSILKADYHQYRALTAAALGNYQKAREALAEFEAELKLPANLPSATQLQERIAQEYAVERAAALVGAPLGSPGLALPRPRFDLALVLQPRLRWSQQQGVVRLVAELRLWRGLLALEQGATAEAEGLFADSLRMAGQRYDFLDRPIAERCAALLAAQRK